MNPINFVQYYQSEKNIYDVIYFYFLTGIDLFDMYSFLFFQSNRRPPYRGTKGLPPLDVAFIWDEFFIYLFYFILVLFHAFLYRRGCIHLSYTDTQYIVLISNSLPLSVSPLILIDYRVFLIWLYVIYI